MTTSKKVKWREDEIVVLCAIFSASPFSSGDDEHPECKLIAYAFERTPGTIDRQWRNIKDYLAGLPADKVGQNVKKWADLLLDDPTMVKNLAKYYCEKNAWPLEPLIKGEKQ